MVNISEDILSVSDFKRRSSELLSRIKKTRQPIVLTVNGRAEAVVQDAASYQEMVDLMERLDVVAGIHRGLEDMKAGRERPLDELDREMRAKHRIPPKV